MKGYFEKFLKCDFSEICILFWFHVRRLLTRTKKVRSTKIPPVFGKKNFTGVNFDVFTVFLREHEKSLRQQCSWLDQKKSVMFRAESLFFRNDAEEISYFQSWLSIVQNSSESIRRSRLTSQVLLPNHILGGRNCM